MRTIPESVDDAVAVWLETVDEVAPGTIEGLYVVGSVALGDWTTHSDIDVVAVVADPSDLDLGDELGEAHAQARERTEHVIDGPFVAWGDLVVPPMAVRRPAVLDGVFELDGEPFEINPVTWYTLAEYGVAIRGPQPDQIGIYLDDAARRTWAREQLHSYWRGVGERLDAALVVDGRADGFDGAVLEWTVLGVARVLHTIETGGVISKSEAGAWAAARGPDFAPLLDAAVEQRHRPGTVGRGVLLDAVEFVGQVVALAS